VGCLSELVQTLWFEDVGFLHEQMLDTPVGRFSIRQMGIFLIFGLLAWITSLVFVDLVLKIVVAGAIFVAGAVFFTRKIRTVSPEAHLLCFIRRVLQINKKHVAPANNQQFMEQVSKSMLLSATLGVPVKVAGVLKDFSGKILCGKNFKVNINNTTYSNGTTDQEGCFCTYFISDRPGRFEVDIQPENTQDPAQKITIQVNPKKPKKHQKKKRQTRMRNLKPKLSTKLKQPPPQTVCTYEVFPVNYVMLPKQKRLETLGRFQCFLNSLPCQVKLTAVKTQKTLEITENEVTTTYYRFFIEALEPIDWLIEQCGFKQQPLTELPKPKTVKTFSKYLQLENGRLQKTFTVYQLPGKLLPGFISELYGLCEKVLISIKPLPPEVATSQMGKYLRLQKSILLADQSKGRLPKEQTKLKHDMAQATYQSLITGNTRLFELKINLTLQADNHEELTEQTKKLKDTLQARFIRLDCPAYFQQELANGITGKKIVADTTTVSTFFPFVSADLIESPGGVFLGINQLTGAPIVFDPHLRMNQNIVIMGKSGAGKSFTSKILLTRLLQKHKNLAFFIVDPENEYSQVGKLASADVLDITTEKQLGLDPIQIFSDNKDTATSILADLAGIEDNKTYQELRSIVGANHDLLEVYQNSPPNLKDRLSPFVTGTDSFLTMGQPQVFSNRMVFNLSALHRQLAMTQRRSLTFQAANILVFSKIWQMLDNTNFLPLHVPKLVIIDELWLYTSLPAASFLEGVSRRGRKRNVTLLLNSQRLADVLENSAGRAVIENCATKVMLRQDESAIRQAGQTIGLSTNEMETLLELNQGQGLIVAGDIHLPIDFLATQDEYKVFTTKPTERSPPT
jgi:Cdc6-like AAA superfamily ATPase